MWAKCGPSYYIYLATGPPPVNYATENAALGTSGYLKSLHESLGAIRVKDTWAAVKGI